MIKEKITTKLKEIVKVLNAGDISIELTIPTDLSHGDYTTNLAMRLFRAKAGLANAHVAGSKKGNPLIWGDPNQNIFFDNPLKLAEFIKQGLGSIEGVEKIETASPGFINFWIDKEELGRNMVSLLNDGEKAYETIKTKSSKLEIYENTGPNTNKPLHIGHLRNISIGVSLVNLRKAIGHNALSENINNDRGIHIIKAMWAYLEFGKAGVASVKEAKEFTFPEILDYWKDLLRQWFSNNTAWNTPKQLKKKSDHLLGVYYMLGDIAEKQKPESIEQMKEMLLAWEDGDTHVRLLWEMMNGWFYEGFRQTHARFLGIKPEDDQYDKEWYESELYLGGRETIMNNLGKGVFYKREDNVIMADLKKYGVPDKVVIRSDGSSLYITFDLEQAKQMALTDKADLIAHVVAIEQELYFKQVFAIVDALGIAPKEKFLHFGYGMVNLSSGAKMSSREGTVILADELMDLVKERIRSLFPDIDDEVADKVAIGAIKFMMLKYNTKAAINFDIESSVSLEGNSGPYIQYAYARTQSILRKGKGVRGKGKEKDEANNLTLNPLPFTLAQEELDLLRMIYHFPETVQKAAESYSPNVVCEYLFELTKKFNLFYQKHRVLDVEDEAIKAFRVGLTAAVGVVIKDGLNLLGIAAPERM